MVAKKAAKKSARKASKATKPYPPIVVLYGPPIYAAIKRGDAAEMKKLATQARKHVSDVTSALAALDKALGKKR